MKKDNLDVIDDAEKLDAAVVNDSYTAGILGQLLEASCNADFVYSQPNAVPDTAPCAENAIDRAAHNAVPDTAPCADKSSENDDARSSLLESLMILSRFIKNIDAAFNPTSNRHTVALLVAAETTLREKTISVKELAAASGLQEPTVSRFTDGKYHKCKRKYKKLPSLADEKQIRVFEKNECASLRTKKEIALTEEALKLLLECIPETTKKRYSY
ncbi:MAG: hypothetical protein ABW127_09790 [Candidatus Thiodiazotropha endolucinida]